MKTRVLDSWPILEWMYERGGAAAVGSILDEAEAGTASLFMSAINAGEIYYFLHKQREAALAERWRSVCPTMPVRIHTPSLDDIWEAAGVKARFPLSYAGAFAAALAQKHRCPLMTGDPEFRAVSGLELDWVGS